jgi:P27 family predicted phage terminase small subunit
VSAPKKPSALHLVHGTARKDRTNGQEPEPDLVLDLTPPADLEPASALVWAEVAPMLKACKILTVADVIALRHLCDAEADYRKARAERDGKLVAYSSKGSQMMDQYLVAQLAISKTLKGWLTEFGMTPSSRSRVAVDMQPDLFGDKTSGTGRFFKGPAQ